MGYFTNKNVCVIGSSGLLGSNLVKRLRAEKAQIRAVYNNKEPMVRYNNVLYQRLNMIYKEHVQTALHEQEIVFMCAAHIAGAQGMADKKVDLITPNITMAANVLRECYEANVKKVMCFGSTTSYPEAPDHAVKEDECFLGDPADVYFHVGWMKRYTEKMCEYYSKIGLPALVLRPSNIYGDFDKFDPAISHVTPALVKKVADRQSPLEVWGDGSEERDLIYVDDMVDACLYFMEKQDGYDPVNIGYGTAYSVNDILNILMDIEGFAPDIKYLEGKPRMMAQRYVDVGKASSLGFKAKTTLREGLEKTLRWYQENVAS